MYVKIFIHICGKIYASDDVDIGIDTYVCIYIYIYIQI